MLVLPCIFSLPGRFFCRQRHTPSIHELPAGDRARTTRKHFLESGGGICRRRGRASVYVFGPPLLKSSPPEQPASAVSGTFAGERQRGSAHGGVCENVTTGLQRRHSRVNACSPSQGELLLRNYCWEAGLKRRIINTAIGLKKDVSNPSCTLYF